MVKMQKIEDEAKAVIAEGESVASSMLGALTPRWTKFVDAWKSWGTRKKSIAAVVIVAVMAFAWHFGVDVTRLAMGSYRSAYSYGHGTNVTPDQVSDLSRRIDAMEADVHQVQIELHAVEDKLAQPQKPLTTDSITHHKKSR